MEGGDGADGSAGGGQGGGLTYIKRGAGAEAWEGGGECAKYKSGIHFWWNHAVSSFRIFLIALAAPCPLMI
jgi:hypothetical protein